MNSSANIFVMITLYQIIILIFSAVIHEYMHGWMADRLGDQTAKAAGRLTLNPIKHLEFFGSFLLPGMMLISGMPFAFGWAKPVPYNPFNLRDKRYGEAKVALAGPLANLTIAVIFGLLLAVLPFISLTFSGLLSLIIYINLVLMLFNLLPLPPLDGSKILAAFLPESVKGQYLGLERFGFILVILFAWIGFPYLLPVIDFMYQAVTIGF
ncbi:site-2 protease family protein [Candidatus Falkowbacteria bacterium HGW-Falkowbacteria-2]|uniref:Site-2 protease family protein n=1 Tax=Candidatus Falkowbacteria bacterium HGW-Falkowbacteria-2 TaxID=2013769 RepID=A0A2N2E0C9_9BACT|nr:MAG: site-2 protease family protein [Candidatus Falkowbacteria bacterium HGW-Falkowbacteria-2]